MRMGGSLKLWDEVAVRCVQGAMKYVLGRDGVSGSYRCEEC
jgi:hypothetical protein